MNYYNKYLKYKNKYTKLKNQFGGYDIKCEKLPYDTRRYIAQNSQICKLDTNKYFKTDLGQGSLVYNQDTYNFNSKEKLVKHH